MHIEDRPLKFWKITHHASVTQCLGPVGGHVWYLEVAMPSILDASEIKDSKVNSNNIVRSPCGHFYVPPCVEDIQVFKVIGTKFLKLNRGTWHAGPIFKGRCNGFLQLGVEQNQCIRSNKYWYLAMLQRGYKDDGLIIAQT